MKTMLLAVAILVGSNPVMGLGTSSDTAHDFKASIARFDRVELAHLPTPLEELKALTAELGGVRLYIKRDDQTGLAFGGNKARKLDFIMADVTRRTDSSILVSSPSSSASHSNLITLAAGKRSLFSQWS